MSTEAQDALRGAIARLSLPDDRGMGREGAFYGALAEQLTFKFEAGLPADGAVGFNPATARIEVLVEPRKFHESPPTWRAALLLHELLHVVLGHLPDMAETAPEDRPLANNGMDVSVNQFLPSWASFGPDDDGYDLATLHLAQDLAGQPKSPKRMPWQTYAAALKALPQRPTVICDVRVGSMSADQGMMRAVLQAVFEAAGKQAEAMGGAVPDTVREQIRAANRRARMHWRQHLRAFGQTAMSIDREFTRRRPNRKSGWAQPGTRKTLRARVLFAVDTSGSMDSAQLAEVLPEINALAREADVVLVDCDTEIRAVREVTRPLSIAEFEGRGGTSFEPVFTLAASGKLGKLDAIIYYTDGWGYGERDIGVPTLWLLTDRTANTPTTGRALVLPGA